MFLVGLFTWWYEGGWKGQLVRVKDRLHATLDFFSIPQLLKTLFSPFRQISAGKVSGPLGVIVRAFFDQLLSRVIGFVIRFFTILFGVIVLVLQFIYETFIVLVWLLLPAFPLIGLIVMIVGWVPQWR